MPENNNTLAKASGKELEGVVDGVQKRISALEEQGGINFPPNYSVANALRSAWLIIQEAKDVNKRPALEVCTKDSVCNALFNTVVQGLIPSRKQVYYIVYGNQLQAQRSYFGTQAVVKRLPGIKDVWADVVYPGDAFEISKLRGGWKLEKHESKYENIDPENFVAAYCVIEFDDGRPDYMEVMNRKQIETSWNKSRSKDQAVHKEFPDQMAKRTVINRACKNYVNTSDDSDLMIEAFVETGDRYQDDPSPAAPKQDKRLQELNATLAETTPVRNQIEATIDEDGEQNAG